MDGYLLLHEPVYAWSSLVYLAAAALARPAPGAYLALVAGIGVGSFVQHGPNPSVADLVHDLPLAGTLAFVAADAVAGLRGQTRRWWWWGVPTVALVPLILASPLAADAAQAGMAAAAIALTLARARAHPGTGRRTALALALLASGAAIGTLFERGGPLFNPAWVVDGHALWHVLSSASLVVLAPLLGHHRRGSS